MESATLDEDYGNMRICQGRTKKINGLAIRGFLTPTCISRLFSLLASPPCVVHLGHGIQPQGRARALRTRVKTGDHLAITRNAVGVQCTGTPLSSSGHLFTWAHPGLQPILPACTRVPIATCDSAPTPM